MTLKEFSALGIILAISVNGRVSHVVEASLLFLGTLPAWKSYNAFGGNILNSLDGLRKLLALGLASNNLIGTGFDMYYNPFTGTFPTEVGKLQNLHLMYLSDNQISGEIPISLGNLSLLEELSLENNKLSGIIPSSLGNLKQLSLLNLSLNDLSGTIPEQVFNIPFLLISLNLAQNQLIGSIPSTIGNLKVLSQFDVSSNKLSGEISNEIGICSNLAYLYLEGKIFPWIYSSIIGSFERHPTLGSLT
ncbi:hypothetical protein JRO89_XS14G0102000 [Xanthoceras sorbifolium]|uniref:Uncharacterized protein n=1 Tax=Xanthoceras sorbifolium TaxID=99658 RepID=A0ABQ8H4T0_9ROSI|nr:hypothetical protein JRO89_XS14G0102000 [Xanthoceras sorbifolium]